MEHLTPHSCFQTTFWSDEVVDVSVCKDAIIELDGERDDGGGERNWGEGGRVRASDLRFNIYVSIICIMLSKRKRVFFPKAVHQSVFVQATAQIL